MYFSKISKSKFKVVKILPSKINRYSDVRKMLQCNCEPPCLKLLIIALENKRENVSNLDTKYFNIIERFREIRELPSFVGKNLELKSLIKP